MAFAAVQSAMDLDRNKGLHPFFSKPSKNAPPISDGSTEPGDDPGIEPPEPIELPATKKRGRKPGSKNIKKKDASGNNKQPSLETFARRLKGENANSESSLCSDTVTQNRSLENDTNKDRRKRRKTASPRRSETDVVARSPQGVPMDWEQQLTDEAGKDKIVQQSDATTGLEPTDITTAPKGPGPHVLARAATPLAEVLKSMHATQECAEKTNLASMLKTSPRKVLKVNRNGKLLSSPPPASEADLIAPKKRRARKTSKAKAPSMVVVVKYGKDPETRKGVGESITAILEGKSSAQPTSNLKATTIKPDVKPAGPPKSTHPFFLGNAAQKKGSDASGDVATANALQPSPKGPRKSTVTPGKLKVESRNEYTGTLKAGLEFGAHGTRISKHAGMSEAAWPSQETAHVRNLDGDAVESPVSLTQGNFIKNRKLKRKIMSVTDEENLMAKLSLQLELSTRHAHTFPPSEFEPPPNVRLPTRLLSTGAIIQDRVLRQLHAPLQMPSKRPYDPMFAHPAIQTVFLGIEHDLTAFDLSTCETQSWVQKYAPKQASHVLQSGPETLILQDWLQNLTVLTVGGAQSEPKTTDVKQPPKKKRKKAVDDFIVDSDEEEEEEMVEVDNCEGNTRSVRRARWTRNQNVVVISGPPGCGKSAMVYAVAKELEFEVFEINSGSRRSGKDIFDKVGDMSENHLVNHRQKNVAHKPDTASAEESDVDSHVEAFQKDMESGRQSTMASFLKAKNVTKPSSKPKAQKPKAGSVPSSTQATLTTGKSRPKSQKQSLILFEEADILFEEDQQFWSSVTKLASLSKRPVIITCNTESLIPLSQLPLAAILRLSPPKTDLATDYMLVLAGHEGHVLEREAVSSLYRYKDHDLRASIMELNFWCQMSVGDKKGGLEWMYQRWPPGKDVDANGHILRVASENTYLAGMGCVSHNISESEDNIVFGKQTELLKETWTEWNMEPSGWAFGTKGTERPQASSDTPLELLKRLDALSDSLSAADVYCRVDLPSYEQHYDQLVDPSLPTIPDKERLNYTTGAPLIQTDSVSDYSQLDTELSIQSHILIQQVYGGRSCSVIEDQLTLPTTEAGFAQAILSKKQSLQKREFLTRLDFSEAFDILAEQPDAISSVNTSYNLHASSFDRTFRIIVEDVAPYVRCIVAYESLLAAQRIRLGNLLSEGGQGGSKRLRTTRAARTALEGGDRNTKRRERWFNIGLNHQLVMRTGGKAWAGMGSNTMTGTETGSQQTDISLPASPEP